MKTRIFFSIAALMLLAGTVMQARVKDLSADETANCYMVPSGAASYSFNALVKGNGVAVCGESASIKASTVKGVKLLWQDANVVDAASVAYSGGRVSFKTCSGVKTGNAVIALYSDKACGDGTCLWSWHIWMTDARDSMMAGLFFLDRNLGADAPGLQDSGRNGLFYQWGRKDPFPQTGELACPVVAGKHSPAFAAAHPDTFITRDGRWFDGDFYDYWCKGSSQADCMSVKVTAETKTMYDPCPAGYHVPNICDIEKIKGSGKHSFIKAGARWYDVNPSTPDKVGELGYYWCATIDRLYQSRGGDFYIWNVGVGIALGSHYYNSSAFCVRPQKFQ